MDPKLFTSNEAVSPQICESKFNDRLTRVHPVTPFIVFIPVALFFIGRSIYLDPSILVHYLWIIPGVIVFWGLLEFVLHKYVLHHKNKSLVTMIHVAHHEYPNDPLRLCVPLWSSIPGGIIFYFSLLLLVGPGFVDAIFGSLVGMYVVYEFTHAAVHKYNWKNPLFQKFKKHHLRHHYHDNRKAFGFTTVVWDKVFGTDIGS